MQKGYEWLEKEPGPKMLLEALKLFGTKEITGKENNPVILAWAKEAGLEKFYSNDEVPWCGLFMALIAKRAGKAVPDQPLWALNWQKFGVKANTAMLGDVIVVKRPTGGHVGLYVGEDAVAYHVLAGNQSNAVNIARIAKNRVYAVRRPSYITQPANVRKIMLTTEGPLSTNEK